jgi:hypothetical protein
LLTLRLRVGLAAGLLPDPTEAATPEGANGATSQHPGDPLDGFLAFLYFFTNYISDKITRDQNATFHELLARHY